MNYTDDEVSALDGEDFETYFTGTIGTGDGRMDVLTIVHKDLSFDEAEKNKALFEVTPGINMHIVPYEFLKFMKLRTNREKDLWDIARLEELRNKK